MDAFIGEIRAFPYNFTPRGWLLCEGGYVAISDFTALYSIIGITYGGDGRVSMRLPNIQGRSLISTGQSPVGSYYPWGYMGGADHIYITEHTMPAHPHVLSGATIPGTGLIAKLTNKASTTGDSYLSNVVVKTSATTGLPSRGYSNTTPANAALAYESMSLTGQTIPHNNMQPFLTMRYFINYDGIYPPRP